MSDDGFNKLFLEYENAFNELNENSHSELNIDVVNSFSELKTKLGSYKDALNSHNIIAISKANGELVKAFRAHEKAIMDSKTKDLKTLDESLQRLKEFAGSMCMKATEKIAFFSHCSKVGFTKEQKNIASPASLKK